MDEKAKASLRKEIEKQALILIRGHMDTIVEDYELALEAHNAEDNERKFSYKIGMGFTMTCDDPDKYSINGQIYNSVKHLRTSSGAVRVKDDLVDMMNEASGESAGDDDDMIPEEMVSTGPERVDLDDPGSERPPYPPKKKPGRPQKGAAPRKAPKSPVKPISTKGN